MTSMFIDAEQAKRGNMFMAEPRINAEWEILNKGNNSIFDELSVAGGWGVAYKTPTLLYLYPNSLYYDYSSLLQENVNDPSANMVLFTTHVVDNPANADLKPSKSYKTEGSLSLRIGNFTGFITGYHERYYNEFGFLAVPQFITFDRFNVPTDGTQLVYEAGGVTYLDAASGQRLTAQTEAEQRFVTYSSPSNYLQSVKKGIEYSFNFGQIRPIRTSIVADGAWFSVKRISSQPYYAAQSYDYAYLPLYPSGVGTLQNRVNTNFRFITHIPSLKLVFSTTVQVVWYESLQRIWKDSDGNDLFYKGTDGFMTVNPLGFYDHEQRFHDWQSGYETDPEYQRMLLQGYATYYDKETFKPWIMFNFRLTKEIGKMLDISFTANNFTNTSRWHRYKATTGYKQIYPDMYFGAELRVRIHTK